SVMRCCFDMLEITTGAKIAAGVMAVLSILGSIYIAVRSNELYARTWEIVGWLGWFALQLVVSILVFVAVNKQRAPLIMPILVFNILAVIFSAFLFYQCLPVLFNPKVDAGSIAPLMLTLVVVSVLQVWFFTVFWNCYKHLKEIESAGVYGEV
ncbi:hypothetical protein PMAYCL1PPCAC_11214, partial [Pristionchus mayeri]